jgi:hypothetical protein
VSRTTRRAASVALAAVLAGAALTGCGAGLDAQTNRPYDPALGSDAVVGNMNISNVVVLSSGSAGISELTAQFVNYDVDDALTGVHVTKAAAITLPDGPIPIPRYSNVVVGPSGTRIFLHDFTGKIGDVVVVTFQFRKAGTVSVDAMVATEVNLAAGD